MRCFPGSKGPDKSVSSMAARGQKVTYNFILNVTLVLTLVTVSDIIESQNVTRREPPDGNH